MRNRLMALLTGAMLLCGLAAAGPAMAATAPASSAVRTVATQHTAVPVPAAVHPMCGGSGCYGQDPELTGCANSATTVLAHDYTAQNQASFALEIRYSAVCQAAWLRLTVWSGSSISFAGSAWNPGGTSVGFSGQSGEETWTYMVPATSSTQACVGTQFYANGNWVAWYYLGCYRP